MTTAVVFGLALICAALMGYAIQSGATCMVYAVSELVENRRVTRAIAMLEAGLWVMATLTIAALLGLRPAPVAAYDYTGITIWGGVLLGLGAYVNGACVFGSIARIGSGEVAFLVTPLGYFLGVMLFDATLGTAPSPLPDHAGPATQLPLLLVAAFALYAAVRAGRIVWATLRPAGAPGSPSLWDPHEATLVIGVTFAVMMLGVGPWTYPELLSDLARGETAGTLWRIVLFAALLLGARLGGLRHGRTLWLWPTAARIRGCLIGGAMMGVGGALIPGGNDGLVLVGLPFLMPYALVALATMVLVIATAILVQRRLIAVNG